MNILLWCKKKFNKKVWGFDEDELVEHAITIAMMGMLNKVCKEMIPIIEQEMEQCLHDIEKRITELTSNKDVIEAK